MAVLEVRNLKKIYRTRFGGNQVQALSCVNFSVEEGEYVAIMGESGSGKTTLINIMAALDRPTEGDVYLDGKPLSAIKDKNISEFRRDNLGFVFQDFNLLDTFNLKDNILLPLVLKACLTERWKRSFILRQRSWASGIFWKNILTKYQADRSRGRLWPAPL